MVLLREVPEGLLEVMPEKCTPFYGNGCQARLGFRLKTVLQPEGAGVELRVFALGRVWGTNG